MIQSGIEPATFRLVAQRLNQPSSSQNIRKLQTAFLWILSSLWERSGRTTFRNSSVFPLWGSKAVHAVLIKMHRSWQAVRSLCICFLLFSQSSKIFLPFDATWPAYFRRRQWPITG